MLGLQVDLKQGRMFDGGSDNPYEGVALSQAAAASIALFQRCSLLEAVSLLSAIFNSRNELIARK